MPSLNFTVFKDKLVKGLKPHTIRGSLPKGYNRERFLNLYEGQRTVSCHRLVETFCADYFEIHIDAKQKTVGIIGAPSMYAKHLRPVVGEVQALSADGIRLLAKNDGFENVDDLFEFFKEPKWRFLLFFDMDKFKPTGFGLQKYGGAK